MSRRGLWDHLGGGFHRYCVDGHWGVPHFEKMLYDQGQLLRVYADLWRRSDPPDDDLRWPVLETAAWLTREMEEPGRGFAASQDADSEGEEGRFYVWTPAAVRAVLGDEDGAAFCDAYAVTEAGNFDGKSVLWDLARGPRHRFAAERAALLSARSKRVPPATDRKRVLGWNALTVSGLAYAASVLGEPSLVASAEAAAQFIARDMRDADGRWFRVIADGQAKVPAFLDDLAAWLGACLDLHRAGGDAGWASLALSVAEEIQERFFDPDENDLFLTPSDAEALPHRPRSDHDGATPHSTGLATLGLFRVATLSGRAALRRTAERVLRAHAFVLERAPAAYPTLARAADWAERGLSAAVVIGDPAHPRTEALAQRARQRLAPEEAVLVAAPGAAAPDGVDPSWLAGRDAAGGAPTAYVCRGTVCSLPITDPDALVPLSAATE
jgi:uncharacterized protein YyaL (SSP411 family)